MAGVLGGFDARVVSLVAVFGLIACARTDFQAFDQFDEAAGESGSNTGGRSNGGSSSGGFAGTSVTGGVAGTSFTGGVGGTGGGVCRDGRERCGGQCVLTESDPNHCGGCFNACPDYTECIGGECVSLCDGLTYCSGICTDITRDPLNCGSCGTLCADNQSCRSGYCTSLCEGALIRCGGVCVDWTSDPMNCGGCGNSCGRGMSPVACIGGMCRCPGRQVDCGAGCTDVETDPRHCGRCGLSCAPGESCANGVCTLLPATVTYSVGPSPLSFVSACGQPGSFQLLGDVDDDVAALMLPFAFRFYGTPTSSAWASSNGIVGFGVSTASFQNECAGDEVESAVMAFWDDLATRQPGVCVATLGVAPNRQLVLTWNDAFILGIPAAHLTFSVVLNEGSDVIDVLYGTMSGAGALSLGQDATIGLANEREYALDCCNQACVMANTGRRYVPVLP